MFLQKISLHQFKNHSQYEAEFVATCNCIVGENGSGKTSLLDAIYFLALTKSSLSGQDMVAVQHQRQYFAIKGFFEKMAQHYEVLLSYHNDEGKKILVDKKESSKMSEHVGRFPLVLMAPTDTDLVRDGSETRRKFFDALISQLDAAYLQDLLLYNKLLAQRNALLKQFAERQYFDETLLKTYNEPLVQKAKNLNSLRAKYVALFSPFFEKNYEYLSENREQVQISYSSAVGEADFEKNFEQAQSSDLRAGRTSMGVHKDDFEFSINGHALKKYGSQGQQKAFVMALKLAQFELMQQQIGLKPIVLMDDIFDKLDERRIQMLVEMIDSGHFGQVFISDARPERSQLLLQALGPKIKFIVLGPANNE